MTSAETLREHAKSAVTLLAELASEEDRKCLVSLARAWLKNAERLEQQERLGAAQKQHSSAENGAHIESSAPQAH
jgi:hypothetical protein